MRLAAFKQQAASDQANLFQYAAAVFILPENLHLAFEA